MTAASTGIAHELRTPLASLELGNSSLYKYLPKLIEGYKMARQANLPVPEISDNRFAIIEDILSSMKLEIRSAFTFIDMLLMNLQHSISAKSNEIFLMSDCIKEALTRYPFQDEQKELIHTDFANDFKVQGNVLLATHVFFNLIKNALYYIAAAGKGEISISLARNSTYNKVLFKDTGTGISKAIQAKIFNRFFSRTYHGAGIGLTFCKSVMKSLDGKIICESVESEYTLFTLFFPKIKN